MLLLLRATLALAVVLVVAGECPLGFVHLGDECYYFAEEEFNKEEAEAFCYTLSGTLASFDNCSHFVDVSRYLEVGGLETNGRSYWIGADGNAEYWIWSNTNNPFPYGAPYWDPYEEISSGDQQCAVISSDGGYLRPRVCTDLNLPLCEAPLLKREADEDDSEEEGDIEMEDLPDLHLLCPDPFSVVGDRCIYLNDAFLTWDEARVSCGQLAPDHFSDLAVLSDCDVFGAVARHMEAQQGEAGLADWAWVGARDFDDNGVYRWLNGDYAEPGVPFWCPGQPNQFQGTQSCAMLWGTHFFYGADEDCSTVHKSLCEIGF